MSTTPSPDRRFIVALTAAVASATLAIGVTTAALLGWIGPRSTPGEPGGPAPAGAGSAQVVYVPITPTTPASIEPVAASEPRLAMAEASSPPDDRHHRHDRDDRHDRRDHEEDDDD